jgi:aryl-alcohol dehydrogenase-like predicted oxidoreductase
MALAPSTYSRPEPLPPLAWLLSRPAVASAIVGAETVEEITANASAADIALEQAQLDTLTSLRV